MIFILHIALTCLCVFNVKGRDQINEIKVKDKYSIIHINPFSVYPSLLNVCDLCGDDEYPRQILPLR